MLNPDVIRGDTSEAQLQRQRDPVLVIACGALGRELHAIRQANGWDHLRIRCLDPELHLRPAQIPPRLRAEIERARGRHRRIFIGYADCGTYGGIDQVLADYPGVERLPGLHCYEFFAGTERFERMADDEPGTFYLTDFLVRFFDRLVVETLQIDDHPELSDEYFGNYRRLTYLSQTRNPDLLADARAAASRLGLEFTHVHTGYGALEPAVVRFAAGEREGVPLERKQQREGVPLERKQQHEGVPLERKQQHEGVPLERKQQHEAVPLERKE